MRLSLPRLIGGAILTVFGGYILYEKVLLSLLQGQTEERVGLIEQSEGFPFWLTVATFGLCAGAIFIAGLALTIAAFKKRDQPFFLVKISRGLGQSPNQSKECARGAHFNSQSWFTRSI